MTLLETAPRRQRLAIGCSIALHVCALALLLVLPASTLPIIPSFERTLPITIEKRAPEPRPPAPAMQIHAQNPQPAAPAAIHRPHIAQVSVHTRAPKAQVVSAVPNRHELSHESIAPVPSQAFAAADVPAQRVAAPVATDAPQHLAAVATSSDGPPAASGGGGGGDSGLFSASYQPMAEPPSALDAIRATIAAGLRLRITIDQTGHATDVQWLTPPKNTALSDEIRAKLMALTYIPAQCDGLPCAGTIEIRT